MVAGGGVIEAEGEQGGIDFPAHLRRDGTTRMKAAALRERVRFGRFARADADADAVRGREGGRFREPRRALS